MAGDCILCGKCLEVCPLLRATGREELSPRAKANLYDLLSHYDPSLSWEDSAKLAGLCLGCRRCVEACPQSVDVPSIVAAFRDAHPDFKGWLWKTWLTRADKLWSTSGRLAKFMPKGLQSDKFGPLLKMLAGMREGAGLTPFLKVESFPDTHRGETMLLFAGCTANYVKSGWLDTTRFLLDGLGVELTEVDFTCCGGGLKTAGFPNEAGSMEAANVAAWREAGRPKIVVFCASCLSSLQRYGGKSLRGAAEAQAWRESLIPLATLLEGATFSLTDGCPERVGYHRPCHVDEADSDFRLLQAALGDGLAVATDRQCCGFGGVMQLGAPDLSAEVNRQCTEVFKDMDAVITGCSACVAQLSATMGDDVAVGHWLEGVEPGK